MRHLRTVLMAGILTAGLGVLPLHAQTASQTVMYSVGPSSRASLSGSAAPLVLSRPMAGQGKTSASVGGSTYAIATNETNQKIRASLSRPMPSGTSLSVSLAAPSGAATIASATLGTTGVDVVTGVSSVSASDLPITYTLNAGASAKMTAGTRLVTYTITSGQ